MLNNVRLVEAVKLAAPGGRRPRAVYPAPYFSFRTARHGSAGRLTRRRRRRRGANLRIVLRRRPAEYVTIVPLLQSHV